MVCQLGDSVGADRNVRYFRQVEVFALPALLCANLYGFPCDKMRALFRCGGAEGVGGRDNKVPAAEQGRQEGNGLPHQARRKNEVPQMSHSFINILRNKCKKRDISGHSGTLPTLPHMWGGVERCKGTG